MARQVGSTSGTASADRETAVTPGGASEVMLEGASGVTGAAWPEPGSPAESNGGAVAGLNGRETVKTAAGTSPGRRRGWLRRTPQAATAAVQVAPSMVAAGPDLDLASNDPLVGYLLSAASTVDITGLQLQSPALKALQKAGVVLVVPLISSGSLVGLLSLGARRSERGYSTDDLRLSGSGMKS
jgi:hypothetical protein